jgi:sugar phosphate isomerase/epimerase
MGEKLFSRLAASPCCNPKMPLEELFGAYADMGFRKYEIFTTWVNAAFDIDTDPQIYRDLARRNGISFASMHLPPVRSDEPQSLKRSIRAARFAAELGAPVVLFKADSIERYVESAGRFLDAIDELPVAAVLQNQVNTPISSLDDFRATLEGIDDDRMGALLEVGHFHSAGVSWQEGYDLLANRIRLVHIKDKAGTASVVFGTGEIDYPEFFRHMRDVGYTGDFVMEIEAGDREHTMDLMRESLTYLETTCEELL